MKKIILLMLMISSVASIAATQTDADKDFELKKATSGLAILDTNAKAHWIPRCDIRQCISSYYACLESLGEEYTQYCQRRLQWCSSLPTCP
ncbi:MAG: hypothetical protein L3J53_01745 [Proteobacteria bacterium]|nr:hypothetical protein [Pseudomonadota bacterium]